MCLFECYGYLNGSKNQAKCEYVCQCAFYFTKMGSVCLYVCMCRCECGCCCKGLSAIGNKKSFLSHTRMWCACVCMCVWMCEFGIHMPGSFFVLHSIFTYSHRNWYKLYNHHFMWPAFFKPFSKHSWCEATHTSQICTVHTRTYGIKFQAVWWMLGMRASMWSICCAIHSFI